MSKGSPSLLKNTATYAIGTFGSKVLAFLIVPLYSYYLNKEEFGYFDVILTGVNLAVPFFSLQISDAIFRWLISEKDDKKQVNKVLTNALVFLLASLVVVLLIGLVLWMVSPLRSHGLILCMTLGAMIYPFFQQVARGLGKSKLFAFNGVLYTLIYLLGNLVLLVVFKMGMTALLLSNIVAYSIASIFLVFRLNVFSRFDLSSFSFPFVKGMILYALPLIPNTISWWLINSANKFIVLTFLGMSYNGIFAMAGRFPVILVMINQVFTLAWQEKAILEASNSSKDLKEKNTFILTNLIKVQLSLVFILGLFSEIFVRLFLSTAYYDAWRYMPVMFLGVAFLSIASFYGAFYLGNKETKGLFRTTIYAALINIVLALVLVSPFGLMGVVIATTIGFLVLSALRARYARRKNFVDIPWKPLLNYLALVCCSFLVCYRFYDIYIIVLTAVCGLSFIIMDNKSQIKILVNKVKNR